MITPKNMMTTARGSMSGMWQCISAVLGEIDVHMSRSVDDALSFTGLDTILKGITTGTWQPQQPQLQPIKVDDSNNRPRTNS